MTYFVNAPILIENQCQKINRILFHASLKKEILEGIRSYLYSIKDYFLIYGDIHLFRNTMMLVYILQDIKWYVTHETRDTEKLLT